MATRQMPNLDKTAQRMVKALLTSAPLRSSKHPICSECGSVMRDMTATFSFGDDESWTLPLPVCVRCDPEQLETSLRGWKLRSELA